jgi:nucleoside-diphosphate-sugar epimerase
LAKTIVALMDKPTEIKILTGLSAKSGTEKYLPSTERARKELGLSQLIDMNDSIRRTLDYHTSSRESRTFSK